MKNKQKTIRHIASVQIAAPDQLKGGSSRDRAELDHMGAYNYTYPGG